MSESIPESESTPESWSWSRCHLETHQLRSPASDHITIPKYTDVADLEVGFVGAPLSDPIADARSDAQASNVKLGDLVDLSDTDLTESQHDALFAVLRKHDHNFDGHIGHRY